MNSVLQRPETRVLPVLLKTRLPTASNFCSLFLFFTPVVFSSQRLELATFIDSIIDFTALGVFLLHNIPVYCTQC